MSDVGQNNHKIHKAKLGQKAKKGDRKKRPKLEREKKLEKSEKREEVGERKREKSCQDIKQSEYQRPHYSA